MRRVVVERIKKKEITISCFLLYFIFNVDAKMPDTSNVPTKCLSPSVCVAVLQFSEGTRYIYI